MGIDRTMTYTDVVASTLAKGAAMFGYRFRLFCIAGFLSVVLSPQGAVLSTPERRRSNSTARVARFSRSVGSWPHVS